MSAWDVPGLPERPGSVEEVLDFLTIEYREASGAEIEGWCPFHDERRPSFGINTSTGLWLCRASCDASGGAGNLAQLVERLRGVPYASADRWLKRVDYDAVVPDVRVSLGEMVKIAVEFAESALDCFCDPPGWALRDRGISRSAAREYGVLWDDEDDAWVLPWRDPDTGVIRGWQTRSADRFDNTANSHKSLSLFGIDIFEPGSAAVLVESPLDAAVLLTAHVSGGLASFGAAVSRAQVDLLIKRASQIVLALDDDGAGHRGTAKLLKQLAGCGRPVYEFNYGESGAKDVGEMGDEQINWGLDHATPRML